jgi:hypothetical protein
MENTKENERCVLRTIRDVREWLSKPEHQIKSGIHVVKWVGATPYISVAPINRLDTVMNNRAGLAAVILIEHMRRSMSAEEIEKMEKQIEKEQMEEEL